MSDTKPNTVEAFHPIPVPGAAYRLGTLQHLILKYNKQSKKLDAVCDEHGQLRWFTTLVSVYKALRQLAISNPASTSEHYYVADESFFLSNRTHMMYILTNALTVRSPSDILLRGLTRVAVTSIISMTAYPPMYSLLDSIKLIPPHALVAQVRAKKFLEEIHTDACYSCGQACVVPDSEDLPDKDGMPEYVMAAIQNASFLCVPCAALIICELAGYSFCSTKNTEDARLAHVRSALNKGDMKGTAKALTKLATSIGGFSQILTSGSDAVNTQDPTLNNNAPPAWFN